MTEFQEHIQAEGFVPQQMFNCDEIKCQEDLHHTGGEAMARTHYEGQADLAVRDASGDFTQQPLLTCHSENPRVFKKNYVMRNKLNVMWKANSEAWVTRQFFFEWVQL